MEERKEHKVNFMLEESVYEKLRKIAYTKTKSVGTLIREAVKLFLEANKVE